MDYLDPEPSISDRMAATFTHDSEEPANLDHYWTAVSGEGPLAGEWEDKPHRLVYDLISEVLRLRRKVGAMQGVAAEPMSSPPEEPGFYTARDIDTPIWISYQGNSGGMWDDTLVILDTSGEVVATVEEAEHYEWMYRLPMGTLT